MDEIQNTSLARRHEKVHQQIQITKSKQQDRESGSIENNEKLRQELRTTTVSCEQLQHALLKEKQNHVQSNIQCVTTLFVSGLDRHLSFATLPQSNQVSYPPRTTTWKFFPRTPSLRHSQNSQPKMGTSSTQSN